MPRKLRQWFENASYHVTCRGNHRNNIFLNEQDFHSYLKILQRSLSEAEEHPYQLLCYCLMTNHVHLLLQTSTAPLGPLMKKINMQYAIYFNKKYDAVGHLFQDRYHAQLILDSPQLMETSRYIHLNPVRANLTPHPTAYAWSSYRGILDAQDSPLIDTALLLSYLGSDVTPTMYQHYVER